LGSLALDEVNSLAVIRTLPRLVVAPESAVSGRGEFGTRYGFEVPIETRGAGFARSHPVRVQQGGL